MAEKISLKDPNMSSVLKTDVTTVKINKNLILAGIGSSVNIYEKGTSNLYQRLNCLRGQKIYGIVTFQNGTKLIVFGGKQFTVVATKNSNDTTFSRLFEPVVCNDWIHSIVWIDEENIAVLTAHNVVQEPVLGSNLTLMNWTRAGIKHLGPAVVRVRALRSLLANYFKPSDRFVIPRLV